MSYSSTVRCYDCDQQVYNLKTHRKVCPNSRYTKSKMHLNNKSKANQASFAPSREVGDAKRCARDISNFANTTDYYALLDVSGSMGGSKLQNAKNTFANQIFTKMQQNDRIAIVTFDTHAYFKLKPRPVGQIRRQNELPTTLDRIFAGSCTAIWDAIHLTVSQIKDKNRRTVIIVLTDGLDNSSSHTYEEVLALVNQFNNISLDIIHISSQECPQYREMCQNRGVYTIITEIQLSVTLKKQFMDRIKEAAPRYEKTQRVFESERHSRSSLARPLPRGSPPLRSGRSPQAPNGKAVGSRSNNSERFAFLTNFQNVVEIKVGEIKESIEPSVKEDSDFHCCNHCNRKYKTLKKYNQHRDKAHGIMVN